ncbi:NAD(P)-binding protein [Aaosphaeria arxii CBS 175.79]|uniref:NAD(P)-binding protein n=1 Tax=Aaosphaeria arxii CBS 175.79 TaxID=1450172 RepID=A0A6A5X726_9PLEO|nr:NAD(P)-binding protein [Aaosphaeria arxii CBS 175.79]KAF2008584.1 NAD(P)-binding protein [Aaosphaeria arxii CBS 175.79]
MTSQTPVWFITAASSGFGKYIALEALSRGHKVIASARSTSRIQDLAEKGADTVVLDVTSPLPEIKKVAKEANDKYGHITHLVNAAGYILAGAVEETSPQEDYDTFNTNVFGALNVSKAFLPYIRATEGEKTISNFGSIASWSGGPGYGLYCGTKWAISGISESMRAELEPFGIKVTVIEPGYFRTGFLNAGARVNSEQRIKAYDDTLVGQVRAGLDATDNNQPGDVIKGSKVIVDILTHSGKAEGKDIPERVALGSDSPPYIKGKLERTEALLKEWNAITTDTDHK